MHKKSIETAQKGHGLKLIVLAAKNHSEVKLYIPGKVVNGKKVPSLNPGARWYVYYYYTNPESGKSLYTKKVVTSHF